ncbi:MAG: hypothetical protein UIB61_07820 [Treponema sp.]|nr:hypothetical protein [Treponema sp.]
MKYLIDLTDKQVGSLARQYKNLKKDDEYLLYDPMECNIEGKDFVNTTNYLLKDGEIVLQDTDDNDSRRTKFTVDFDKALEWCDCYVTFMSIPFILGNWGDIKAAEEKINTVLARIEKAKQAGKKIYLGNAFSEEFDDIARNYKNGLNKFITKNDLEELSEYDGQFQAGFLAETKITMVVGTNSACGKFSSALKVKKYYEEELGEKVCIVNTEETYPFLDNSSGELYGFCRSFSDLTTDEDLQYLQCLVAKIISEQNPDRIIFVTQAGIGTGGILANYPMTKSGRKMKGVWDILIERAFGLTSVVVCGNWNCIAQIERTISYFNIKGADIDGIYVSPVTFRGSYTKIFEPEGQDEYFYLSNVKGDVNQILPALNGLALKHPNIRICCDYGNLTEEVEKFKQSDSFAEQAASLFATDVINSTMSILDDTQKKVAEQELRSQLDYNVEKESFEKAKKVILDVLSKK